MRWRALAACFIGAAALAAPAGAEERDTLLVTRNTDQPAGFAGADTPGERVFIVTADALTPDDTDGGGDLYERRGDSTTLVSVREIGRAHV